MEDVLVLVCITYGVSLFFGFFLQKYLKIPWMFAALFFGVLISAFGLFNTAIDNESFQLLATLGMLILLFIIGFNLDLREMRKLGKKILLGALFIISLEAFLGSLFLFFVVPDQVANSYLIALVTAGSFATVGEAILLPILSEFNLLHTTFGQITLGIGTFDDIIEVIMLAIITTLPTFLPKTQMQTLPDPIFSIASLASLLLLTMVMLKLATKFQHIINRTSEIPHVHSLLILFIFFSFVAFGGFVFEGLAVVGAILGGIVGRGLLPDKISREDEKAINFLGYIFLSPIFFLSIGSDVSISSLLISPLLIVLIWIFANGSKLLGSFTLFRKLLGTKYSMLMGLGLSVRFSTSLIVQFMLFSSGYIGLTLYSALIASAILWMPVIIGLYSWGLSKGVPP